MPYNIRKSGNEYCVYKSGTNEKVGCSDTRAKATAHMRALYANEGKSASNASIEPAPMYTTAGHLEPGTVPVGNSLQHVDFEVEVDRTPDGQPIYAKASKIGLKPRDVEMPLQQIGEANGQPVVKAVNRGDPAATHELTPDGTVQPLVAATAEAAYVGGYEVMEHQLDPRVVEYDPVGGKDGRACANCQWFVSPNACILVHGEISPTGLSQLWKQEVEESVTGIPVEIVGVNDGVKFVTSELVLPESSEGILSKAREFANSILGKGAESSPANPFTLYKMKGDDGSEQLRFIGQWTNQFEDRGGEIIPEAAHMRMLEWVRGSVDGETHYPVLVNWHALGTEYGQVDCMDYNDGFVVAFGYILPGKEEIAYKVASMRDLGMSHGSIYRKDSITGEIIQYWPFEISDLPRKYAKNSWTEWRLAEMAFSEETKKHLASVGHTAEQIAAAEQTTSAFAAQLKELGIAFKDDQVPDTAGMMEVVGALGTKLAEVTSALEGLGAKVDALVPQVEAANASLDERVAAAIKPTTGMQAAAIHAATKGEGEPAPAGSATNGANAWNAQKFRETVFGNVRRPVSEQ